MTSPASATTAFPEQRVDPAPAHHAWRHRFACCQFVATWLLIIAGASVTSHDAGLAVPDWPTSFGWLNPFAVPMVGNVFYEHGHRMIAMFVGLLTLIQAGWIWRTTTDRRLRLLAAWLVGLVLVQGALGGITVRFLLPPIVSVAHGMLAQTFFCLSLCTAYLLSREWQGTVRRDKCVARPLVRLTSIAAGSVYLQLLLGAVVRHAWKKEMPPEAFPAAIDDLLPPFGRPPVDRALAQAILAHGAFAVVVTTALVFLTLFILRRHRAERRLVRPALALLLLILIQLGLGFLTFATRTNPNVTTTHVTVGATLLGLCVFLVLRAWRAEPLRAELMEAEEGR